MGNVSTGHSTGEAMAAIEKITDKNLPDSMDIEWTDLAFQEKRVGNTTVMVTFALCVIFVFLMLERIALGKNLLANLLGTTPAKLKISPSPLEGNPPEAAAPDFPQNFKMPDFFVFHKLSIS